jgi:transcriptional regulator with XRE-family HTH domain
MAPAFTPEKMRMAASLLAARKRAGMSQERAAAQVGTSRRHWIRWESGETMPNPLYLERIAAVLAAPELLDTDDEEEAQVAVDLMAPLTRALQDFVRTELAKARA